LKGKTPLFIGVSEDFGVSVEKNEKMLQKKQKKCRGTGSSTRRNWQFEGLEP